MPSEKKTQLKLHEGFLSYVEFNFLVTAIVASKEASGISLLLKHQSVSHQDGFLIPFLYFTTP